MSFQLNPVICGFHARNHSRNRVFISPGDSERSSSSRWVPLGSCACKFLWTRLHVHAMKDSIRVKNEPGFIDSRLRVNGASMYSQMPLTCGKSHILQQIHMFSPAPSGLFWSEMFARKPSTACMLILLQFVLSLRQWCHVIRLLWWFVRDSQSLPGCFPLRFTLFCKGNKGGSKENCWINCMSFHRSVCFTSTSPLPKEDGVKLKDFAFCEYAWDAPWAKQLCLRRRRLSPMLPTHTYLAGEIPWSWRWSTQGEAQPLHFGCVVLCEFPKCGNLDCIICGSGGLRPRSPLIVLFNCNKCLTLGLFYGFSCFACLVLPPQCIHWCHWLVVKVTFYSKYTCSPLPQVGCFDQKCLLESLDLPVCWFYCSLCCLWDKDVMSSGFCGDLSETARAYLVAFHWGLLCFVRGIKGGAKKIDKLITYHFTEVFASLQLVLYQKRMVWNWRTLDSVSMHETHHEPNNCV